MSSQYFIPDLLVTFPWQRILNPALAEVRDDSNAWVKSLALFEQTQLRRRDTCGAKPTFSFLRLGLKIPNAVFDNPFMISLIENAADLVAITNDMHSYRVERSRGLEVHNIITAIMEEYHLDLQQALYWLSGYASGTISNFLTKIRTLPSWGEKIDRAVKVYIDQVARCVRGCDAWSYEANGCYGDDGLKVRKCRKISLLPPDSGYITRAELELELIVA